MTSTTFNSEIMKIELLLLGFSIKLTGNKENAKDLMQETMMRCYDKRDRFQEGTNFKAWVTTIMYNSFINHYRRAKIRNGIFRPVADFSYLAENMNTEGNAENIIFQKELRGMINALADTYKVPFKLFTEGYHYNEIAEKMNIPMGTVKSRIYYARQKLSKSLCNRYDEYSLIAA